MGDRLHLHGPFAFVKTTRMTRPRARATLHTPAPSTLVTADATIQHMLLPRRAALFLAGVVALAGCGAKTGLSLPDGDVPNNTDGGPILDGSLDAGVPDPDAGPPPPDLCIEVPEDGEPVAAELLVEAIVGRADVVFLIDTTASMGQEIDQIRSSLRDRLAPAIQEAIPDSQIGVATFADFPVAPYGANGRIVDLPFVLRLPTTGDVAPVQAALNAIELGDGQDSPESQVEGLYQLFTGDGIGEWVPRSIGCPRGGFGYACMRTDALPVVLLFTDAPFHNGPGPLTTRNAYDASSFPPGAVPHTYDEMLAEVTRRDGRVIGFDSGEGAGRSHLEEVARDTGTMAGGEPLVYSIGSNGSRLSTSVVEAIQTFAGTVRQDIFAEVGPPPNPGAAFVELIEPLRAEPPDGIDGIVDDTFVNARAGTRLVWRIVVRADIPREESAQRYRLDLLFRADLRRRIQRQAVDIVIPGLDGSGCDDL